MPLRIPSRLTQICEKVARAIPVCSYVCFLGRAASFCPLLGTTPKKKEKMAQPPSLLIIYLFEKSVVDFSVSQQYGWLSRSGPVSNTAWLVELYRDEQALLLR